MAEYFPGQKPDEEVQVLARPHWLSMLRPILAFMFLAVVPVIILGVASATGLEPFGFEARPITVTLVPAFYLMLVTWFFIRWLDYYLDVGIVTTERVVDIDQQGLFRRNVAELDVKMVQDVAAERSGILPTFFNFGDVVIQTAGERPNFTFHAVPNPDAIVDKLKGSVGEKAAAEEEATEKMAEAAQEMKEAAQEIKGEDPAVGQTQRETAAVENEGGEESADATGTARGQSNADDQDLPREYER